jgi:hypothetical protein
MKIGEFTLIQRDSSLTLWRVRHTCGQVRLARVWDLRNCVVHCICLDRIARITNINAAWLAAAVDGEGTVCMTVSKHKRTKTLHVHPAIVVSNTVRAYTERALLAAGCGNIAVSDRTNVNTVFKHTGLYYAWQVLSWKHTEHVARAIQPHLVIKQAKAAAMIACCEYRKTLERCGFLRLSKEANRLLIRYVLDHYLQKFQPDTRGTKFCVDLMRR